MSAVVNVLSDVVESVYTPGINKGVVITVWSIFTLLILTDIALLVGFGLNIHVVILTVLTLGLGAAIVWFMNELMKVTKEQQAKEQRSDNAEADSADKSSSSTAEKQGDKKRD